MPSVPLTWPLNRLPLRVSVPLALVVPVLLVSATLALLSHFAGRANARDLTQRHLEQVHRQIDGHLDQLLEAPAKINAVNHALIAQGKLPLDDLDAWRQTLTAQLHAHPELSGVAFGSPDGRAVWICRYIGDDEHTYFAVNPSGDPTRMHEYRVSADGSMSDQPTSTFDYDVTVRPWYRAPLEADAAAWCEPFVFVGGADADAVTLGISHGLPYRDAEGRVVGIIDADLSLNDISNYLARLAIGEAGQVYVTDHAGLLVGSSMDAALADADADGARIAVTDADAPWIADSASAIAKEFGGFRLGRTHSQTITVEGRWLLMLASPYTHHTGIAWTTVTLIPEDDFLAGVQATRRRSLTIAAVAALLTLLLGFAAALVMIRPILRLTEHVRHIGQGDLDREIHLREAPELARLSDQINAMTEGLRDRARMRHSLAVAMDVQQALLPDDSPSIPGLDVAGHSTYCDETGGDYYDFLDVTGLGDKAVCVALGDVMGHGVAAAMLMATARGILRSRTDEPRSLGQLLEHMNRLLVIDTGGQRFMTMLLTTLDAEQRVLRWASAGHEPPFYYDPHDDAYHELEGSDLPLGIIEDEQYEDHAFEKVRPGQVFFMATDGVWEMQNADSEQFGKQRIHDLIRAHHAEPAEAIGKHIRDALLAFRGDDSQDDDITFVVIRVE